jgi:pilus assembly protein FimV
VSKALRIAIATGLLLAAGNALALGLGQIEVKSRINQPLLAEIPIISTTPGELQALQARLASAETFRRVGLQPPQGIAADLRFSLGNDARGRPVIRVTTVAPVNQAVLNFLIEVDWGQGRLVREYSALVDAPHTASAPLQPAIVAPVVTEPNVVQRPVAPAVVITPAAPAETPVATAPSAPVASIVPAKPSTLVEPVAEPVPAAIAITPSRYPEAALAPAPAAPRSSSQYGPVKAGESLSKIASGLGQGTSYNLDQTMLALLRANPDAFLNDNINLLRQGSVLRVPRNEDRASISADEAQLVVREQMRQWRQPRRAVMQPEVATGTVPTRNAAPAKPAASTAALESHVAAKPVASKAANAKPANAAKTATTTKPAAAPQQVQARLEIVPAAVAGKATGTRSGTNAGGEGSMLQQQLQQRDEDLSARKAEISDLKERVAELEKLKQQQAELLTMKDTELATAQQRLANARAAANIPAAKQHPPVATAAAQTTQPANQSSHASSFMPWLWGGLAFVVLALLGWLFSRRRSSTIAQAPRRSFDSEALAASMRGPLVVESMEAEPAVEDVMTDIEPMQPLAARVGNIERGIDLSELPSTPTAHVDAPTWHSGRWFQAVPENDAIPPAVSASAPSFAQPGVLPAEPVPEPASAEQRMKLARAFLDIGDDHSAKQLLRELMDGDDPAMRTDAAKLLRELG